MGDNFNVSGASLLRMLGILDTLLPGVDFGNIIEKRKC